jgi:hypothetical protein
VLDEPRSIMSSAKDGGATASGEIVPDEEEFGGYGEVKDAEEGRVEWTLEGL